MSTIETNETEITPLQALAARVGADVEDSDFLFGCHVYCMDYHGGQWSPEYAAMCEIDANMRDSHIAAVRHGRDDRNGEWEAARQWYRGLKRTHGA